MSDKEIVERFIPAPAEAIFALIANPSRHHEIDGSGTVLTAKDLPETIQLGSKFGMNMKVGIKYSMVSTVVEFEPNRVIAWQSAPSGIAGKFGGGRIWRYELEPTEGGTIVRESWDISQEKIKAIVKPARKRTVEAMTKTLERIEEIVTA